MGRVAVGRWREMIGDVRKESFPSALFFFLVLVLLSFRLLCSTFLFAAFWKHGTWEAKGRDGRRLRGRCATRMGAKRKRASSCGLFPVESLEWAVYKSHTLNYTHLSFQHMNFGSIGIVRWFGEETVQVKSSTCLFSMGKHVQAVNFQSCLGISGHEKQLQTVMSSSKCLVCCFNVTLHDVCVLWSHPCRSKTHWGFVSVFHLTLQHTTHTHWHLKPVCGCSHIIPGGLSRSAFFAPGNVAPWTNYPQVNA